MIRSLTAAAVLVLFASCAVDGRSTPDRQAAVAIDPDDRAQDTYALGSQITPNGIVPKEAEAEAFRPGMDVFLSVDVASASTNQMIKVEWVDPSGRVTGSEERSVPVGTRYAAFAAGREVTATRGRHRAIIVINGRRVIEKTFLIL